MKKTSVIYFNNIDAFKGIAILGILLVHCGAADLGGFIGELSSAGAKGVQIFLIISSMLICKSLQNEHSKDEGMSLKTWYIKRFIRLIPLYYIANLFVLVKDGLTSSYWSGTHGMTMGTIISNFLFIHGLYPWWSNAININWYIGTLAIFIVAAPMLYRLMDRIDKLFILLALSWLCNIICNHTIGTIDFGEDTYVWTAYWMNFSIVAQLPVLVIGMILYYILEKTDILNNIKRHLSNGKKSFCYAATGVCLLWLFFMIHHGAVIVEYALVFAIMIFISFIDKIYLIENPIFKALGKYSYGIYLFHFPLLEIAQKLFRQQIGNLKIFICYIVVLTVSFLLSWILVRLVERPIVNLCTKTHS